MLVFQLKKNTSVKSNVSEVDCTVKRLEDLLELLCLSTGELRLKLLKRRLVTATTLMKQALLFWFHRVFPCFPPFVMLADGRDNWLHQDFHVSRHLKSPRDIMISMFVCDRNHREKTCIPPFSEQRQWVARCHVS